MISVKLRYVHEDIDRHGNVRVYFWRKGGRKVRIRETPGTERFFEIYHKLLAECEAGTLAPVKRLADGPQPGTYRWLCVQYFKSARFARLDPRTQRIRRSVLERTGEPIFQGAKQRFADFPLARLTAKYRCACFGIAGSNGRRRLTSG
jgi:hypothetical protein